MTEDIRLLLLLLTSTLSNPQPPCRQGPKRQAQASSLKPQASRIKNPEDSIFKRVHLFAPAKVLKDPVLLLNLIAFPTQSLQGQQGQERLLQDDNDDDDTGTRQTDQTSCPRQSQRIAVLVGFACASKTLGIPPGAPVGLPDPFRKLARFPPDWKYQGKQTIR